jgi:hypothetical protein
MAVAAKTHRTATLTNFRIEGSEEFKVRTALSLDQQIGSDGATWRGPTGRDGS